MMYKKVIRALGIVMSVIGLYYGMYMVSFGMTHVNLMHKVFEVTPRDVLMNGNIDASMAYLSLSDSDGSSPMTLAQTNIAIGIASCFLSLVVLYYSEKLARNF